MSRRVVIFGGSFNPPGEHHRRIARELAARFDEVVIVPCGPRPDKDVTNDTAPVFRAAMADMAFSGMERVTVELFDLEHRVFTRTHELVERYADRGEVWIVVGSDLILGGGRGESQIQREWERGVELWEGVRFAVLERPGFPCLREDLPPQYEEVPVAENGSSTEIRSRLRDYRSIEGMVPESIRAYIHRYGLYRGTIPNRSSQGVLEAVRCLFVVDEANEEAMKNAAELEHLRDEENPNCVVVIGGDGRMLHAIRTHWRLRLPFFGINAGHRGFLLNSRSEVRAQGFPPGEVIFRLLPLLYVELEMADGTLRSALGFNDAWVERSTSQSAWLEIAVNGVTRIPKLVSDGALVSTAAGSTAYAHSMGAPPLLADSEAWLVVGSNVMTPADWKSALLSFDSEVMITNLNPEKRPVIAFVDGEGEGEVVGLRARMSRTAAVELAFYASHDMAEKIAQVQFSMMG